jgi:excisionase family DNA binding protein
MRPSTDIPLAMLLDELAERIADLVAGRLRQELAQASSSEQSPWLSIANAAAYLDWPKQRLYKLTAQGAIPHYKQDGRLLFRRDELDQWLRTTAQMTGFGRERELLTSGSAASATS